jgi:hypothetical protein
MDFLDHAIRLHRESGFVSTSRKTNPHGTEDEEGLDSPASHLSLKETRIDEAT